MLHLKNQLIFATDGAQWLYNTTALTVYLVGDGSANNTRLSYEGHWLLAQVPNTPSCSGYLESNGVCNCYSGHHTDSYLRQCYVAASNSCFFTETNSTDPDLDNLVVPFVNWGESRVDNYRLNLTFYSTIVPQRRTLIELPNPQCSFVNSPHYYSKGVLGCLDRYQLNVPFLACGFVKTSTPYEDIFSATIHVKQIDALPGWYQQRVIDTPFAISIRVPKKIEVCTGSWLETRSNQPLDLFRHRGGIWSCRYRINRCICGAEHQFNGSNCRTLLLVLNAVPFAH